MLPESVTASRSSCDCRLPLIVNHEVISLWSVHGKATSELMTECYEKMLKQGERPAAALRAAQVERWKQWQSPDYRAAFTLQGEWK